MGKTYGHLLNAPYLTGLLVPNVTPRGTKGGLGGTFFFICVKVHEISQPSERKVNKSVRGDWMFVGGLTLVVVAFAVVSCDLF